MSNKRSFDRYDNYVSPISSSHFTALFNHLQGQVLTVIDASISDTTQREALKTILKRTLWDNYEPLQEWLYRGESSDLGSPPNIFPFGSVQPIVLSENTPTNL